jgi:ribonuclease BN (tRNA processing enzyme)
MKIRILGAHNISTTKAGCASVIIDDILAVDAGSLTGNLTIEQQEALKAVLLTHHHFDHIKDIPLLGMTYFYLRKTIEIYTTQIVSEALTAHLINDVLYPNLTKVPPQKPPIHLNIFEPGKPLTIAGYSVLPVAVNHAVPNVGYEITSFDAKKVFITSDTGPGLEEAWKQVSPNLIIIETTMANEDENFARGAGHLTPALLLQELESFGRIKGYLPQVVLVHLSPFMEKRIKDEVRHVEKALKLKIRFGYEGMKITI